MRPGEIFDTDSHGSTRTGSEFIFGALGFGGIFDFRLSIFDLRRGGFEVEFFEGGVEFEEDVEYEIIYKE